MVEDPFPLGYLLLHGTRDHYRIKAERGRYRIIYRVLERQRRILVVNVRPRGWAYSGYTKRRP
jgi:mRNA-degrading endonuclease RelE of RelBE toxin-antitoxin system